MQESPVKIDILLEPLMTEASDEQADELLSQLITVHAEPVIKGVIRFKLRLNSFRENLSGLALRVLVYADDVKFLVLIALLHSKNHLPECPAFTEIVLHF